MVKRQFSDEERYAVYTVHGEKCYMCGEPVDLLTMQVDHIIPETLLEDPKRLGTIFADYGLPADFNVQSFANWLPACGPCNNRKRSRVFNPTPRIQVELQIAAEKAPKAAALAANLTSAPSPRFFRFRPLRGVQVRVFSTLACAPRRIVTEK